MSVNNEYEAAESITTMESLTVTSECYEYEAVEEIMVILAAVAEDQGNMVVEETVACDLEDRHGGDAALCEDGVVAYNYTLNCIDVLWCSSNRRNYFSLARYSTRRERSLHCRGRLSVDGFTFLPVSPGKYQNHRYVPRR
jgi:hypothetical protein